MPQGDDAPMFYQPSYAAQELGVSTSGLRRLAAIYAEVHEELPRQENTNNRLWPSEAVERLKDARALVHAGRAKSVKEALRAVDRGVDVPAVNQQPEASGEALEVLIREIRLLRSEIQAMREENAALRERVELPSNDSTPHSLLERVLTAWRIIRYGSAKGKDRT